MKAILAILFVFMFASCDKKEQKINAEELKAKYGIVLPELEYDGDEIATSNKGGAKKKANTVLVVVVNDLTISESGGVITTTISPNAQWAGVQDFVDTTINEGAISVCNWYYATPTGGTKTCQTDGSGNFRSWTSDFDYNIHISNWITL